MFLLFVFPDCFWCFLICPGFLVFYLLFLFSFLILSSFSLTLPGFYWLLPVFFSCRCSWLFLAFPGYGLPGNHPFLTRTSVCYNQEQEGARKNQEKPGGARSSQEEPGGARRSQEESGGARKTQEGPERSRETQERARRHGNSNWFQSGDQAMNHCHQKVSPGSVLAVLN